jgi:hypothetical protein
MDRIKNIYAYNIIKAPSLDIGKAESELLVRLLDLDGQFTRGEFPIERLAEKIMDLLESSQVDFPVDRFCLAFVTPFSQRLSVLSSAHSSRMPPNKEMIPGYSCYVAANSSLFKITQADTRVCSDLDVVMKTFIADNRPPQRSLAKLYKSGIHSGMTFSLSTGPLGKGFLFINSRDVGAYRAMKSNHLLIACQLRLICSNALSHHFQGLYRLNPRIEGLLKSELDSGAVFNIGNFCRDLVDSMSDQNQAEVDVTASQSDLDFFFPSATAIYLISEIIANHYRYFAKGHLHLRVITRSEHNEVAIEVSGPELRKGTDISYLHSMASLVSFQMNLSEHSFAISTALEPVQQADVHYSI